MSRTMANASRLIRRSGRNGNYLLPALLASTSLIGLPVLAADSLPTGGSVVAGSVSVGISGNAMTVTQGSDRAIVNWNGFSVGAGHSVNFVQPNAGSAILNRVTGSATSTIAGSVTGNGQVYLINPNGIAITPTGTVKVGGGFVASTLDIKDQDFLEGRLLFNGGGSSAGVSNQGIVTVGRGGYAALIGGTVRNSGLIAVPLGRIGLGSGERATLDLSGDGFLQVALPTAAGAEGQGALVENGGTLSAAGGMVVLTATTAREAARKAVNLSGTIEAKTIEGRNGAIVIGGGEGGSVALSGTLDATAATGTGGSVTVTGAQVALAGAVVDASGAAGGGTVKVGGDRRGQGDTQRAETTTVDAKSIIRADATEKGDGGQVTIWSDSKTLFDGLITARGADGGRGGEAEVSGKRTLAYNGFTDLSSATGLFGTLLLDPYNLTISTVPSQNVTGTDASGDNSVLNVSALTTALSGANVTVSTGSGGGQDGDITVATDIVWSANSVLTLSAAGNIAINGAIRATGTSAGLVMEYGSGKDYSIGQGGSVSLTGTSASLQIGESGSLQSYTLIRDLSALAAISSDLSGRYALAQDLDASATPYTAAVITGTFTGTFTGLGNSINGLTINSSASNAGLFSRLGAGQIRDLTLSGGSVSGTSNVGSLVGDIMAAGTVHNVSALDVQIGRASCRERV